jgi:serine/threonine protein kinase
MPLARVASIFDPIVNTLDVAHAEGILHRDLKPGNIFLLREGGVRLLDFGMARLKRGAPLTAAGTVMGSPSFMAPEAWQGMSDLLDRRADVYSLGVILFLVLAGELPLSGTSLQEKFLGATQGKHKSLKQLRPDLPKSADEWAARALALNREQRFESAVALWDGFLRTFRVRRPNQTRMASLWAKAKGAVQRFGSAAPPAPEVQPIEAVRFTSDAPPSFVREALANTILQREPSADMKPPRQDPPEKTLDMNAGALEASEPAKANRTMGRTAEETVTLSAELIVDPQTEQPHPVPRRSDDK